MKKQTEPTGPQKIRCGNGDDGCGRELTVIRTHPETQMVEAENYNPAAHLCLPCCNKIAFDWGVSFEDVDYVMVAKHNARAGKMGQPGTKEEVIAILDKAGIKRKPRPNYQRPPVAAVPVGDRA